MSASITGRWTQYDEDAYRLPPGLKRIGYDADTGEYFFTGGWKSAPHCEYGVLVPLNENNDTSGERPSASTSTQQELSPALKSFLNPAVPRGASQDTIVDDSGSDSGDNDPTGKLSTTTTSDEDKESESELDPVLPTLHNGTSAPESTSAYDDDGSRTTLRKRKTWKDKIQGFPDRLKSSGSHIVKRSISSSSQKQRLAVTIKQDRPPTPPPKDRRSSEPHTLSPTNAISFSDLGLIKGKDL